jgi:phage terminase large subunit
MQIDWSLLSHQANFIEDTTTRNLALVGGYGAGKTKALAYKLITLALHNPGYEGALLSPTYGMAIKVAVPTLEECLRESGIRFDFSKSSMVFDLKILGKTTRIHTLAAENYKRSAGLNLAFFGVDEADLIQADIARAAWQMLSSRLRRGQVFQGVAVSTPEGYGFLWQYFVDEVRQKPELVTSRRLINAKTRDNPFLPKEYIEELEAQYPPHLIKAYLEGEFVNLVGTTVYYCYDVAHSVTTKTLADFPNHALHVGIDFNVGKMPGIISVVDNQMAYAVDEVYGARNTEELIQQLKRRYPGRFIICYPDATGKAMKSSATYSDIALLQQAGFEVKARSSNPRVADRVAAVNLRLKDLGGFRRAFVNPAKCPKLAEALIRQAYDKSGEPDKSNGFDHPVDAWGYFIHFNWPAAGRGTYSVVG